MSSELPAVNVEQPDGAAGVAEHVPAPAGFRAPPSAQLCTATLALTVAGGIYLAANLPKHVSLAPAWALAGAALVILLANVLMLSRTAGFAWSSFALVYRWTLLSYVFIAGMIEYVFVYDGVSGATLIVLSSLLALFALNVPLVIAFTVARFDRPGTSVQR